MPKNKSSTKCELALVSGMRDPQQFSVETPVFILEDDQMTVSRSKLEHLLSLADNDRMQYSVWNLERIFGVVSQGFFFTSVGAIFSYDTLPDWAKSLSIVGIVVGFLFGLYCVIKEYSDAKIREKHKTKLVITLNEIMTKLNLKKNEQSQENSTKTS